MPTLPSAKTAQLRPNTTYCRHRLVPTLPGATLPSVNTTWSARPTVMWVTSTKLVLNTSIPIQSPVQKHMCVDMCIDMCIDLCTHMCINMCINVCINMCINMCVNMCVNCANVVLAYRGRSVSRVLVTAEISSTSLSKSDDIVIWKISHCPRAIATRCV